jgi:predicted Zn finger-like uncharacterized protein
MKFHCPKCRKQFLLSAKLAGKTIKVRCTSCGSVFRMRVMASAADDRETAPSPEETAENATAKIAQAQSALSTPAPMPDHAAALGLASPAAQDAQAQQEAREQEAREQGAREQEAREQEAREQGAREQGAREQEAREQEARKEEVRHPAHRTEGASDTDRAEHAGSAVSTPVAQAATEAATVAAHAATAAAKAAEQLQTAPVEAGHRYFSVVAGKRLGPMPYAALKRLIQEQKIRGETLVWRKGLDEWLEATRLEELAPLFPELQQAQAPATAGPPPLPPRVVPAADTQPAKAAAADVSPKAAQPAKKIDETTGEEVHLEEMDHQFFALGQIQQPSLRGAEEIQLGGDGMFPLELEEQAVEKGARASLKDFSVMVRMSKRSRAKHVSALVGLFSATALTIALIFTFGDPLAVIFPEKQITEAKRSGPSGFLKTVERKEAKQKKTAKAAAQVKGELEVDLGEDPAALLKAMQEKEWHVSVGEEDLDVDRGQLRDKLAQKKEKNGSEDGGNEPRSNGGSRPDPVQDDPEELSLDEFARRIETRQKDGSLVIASGGKNQVADSMDSAMGSLHGGAKRIEERKVTATVKERESDGVALKAIVARYVAKKVGAERKNFQRCVDSASGGYAGSDGRIKATLHFTEQGGVDRVSVPGAPAELEQCFTRIFDGWRIATVNQKVKIPIAIRFE